MIELRIVNSRPIARPGSLPDKLAGGQFGPMLGWLRQPAGRRPADRLRLSADRRSASPKGQSPLGLAFGLWPKAIGQRPNGLPAIRPVGLVLRTNELRSLVRSTHCLRQCLRHCRRQCSRHLRWRGDYIIITSPPRRIFNPPWHNGLRPY